MTLQIADDLKLPIEAVTQTFAILAKRGVGKTYTMLKMAEEMLGSDFPIVVVDPVGVCWGLRSSADGKQAGLPIVILGGARGDVPLESTGGKLVADLVAEERTSVLLDLSLFNKSEQVRFMADFLAQLYMRNRDPLHLFLDEADEFAPQKPGKNQLRMLGALEDVVRRGRARGLGITMATQRSAVLNKNVLTQIEVLVAMRTPAPQDQKAIDSWIQVHGTPEQRQEMMASLASLPIGAAWFWSPGWLDIFQQVQVGKRKTFDSSATPKVGQKKKTVKKVAEVNLEGLKIAMAATIEKAAAEDPKKLQARIKELQRELDTAKAATPAATPKIVELPAVSETELKRLEKASEKLATFRSNLLELLSQADEAIGKIAGAVVTVRAPATAPPAIAAPGRISRPQAKTLPPSRSAPSKNGSHAEIEGLRPAHHRLLNALAWLETMGIGQPERNIVAAVANVSPKSSSFGNDVSRLSSMELVTYPAPGQMAFTDAGREAAQFPSTAPTLEELHDAWRSCPALRPAHVRLLNAVINAYPGSLSREELAEQAGVSPTSSSFGNDVSRLSSLGLIRYPAKGQVQATELLFPAELV